ncbi:outer membrane protein assembly factor BamA [Thiohalorhabdus denitrificans]|uniref:outer membrane protein assembly factor BamA n=1 Tax=Thiohalorhabdus denitrificans TaxID=381306 RepID=UPI0018D15643|nr:outer membrane protein assembly factor BamA [Thiohalorhabdus denitrificans]
MVTVVAAVGAALAPAAAAFTVEGIDIRGADRIEEGTVRNYLPVEVGEEVDPPAAQRAIHALYETGFFRDVQLLRENGTLVVEVEEKPVVTGITFQGMEELQEDQVREAFQSFGLEERKMFSRSGLRRATLELERQYNAQGYYAVEVNAETDASGEEGVAITFEVDEGRPAKISQIAIVGNERFTDETLKGQFNLTDSAAFAFLSGKDQYARQNLMADLESLRSYYMDRGHLNFQVDSTQVQLSPERQHVFVTINITEGAQYRLEEVSFSGDTVVPEEDLWSLVELEEGDLFSRSRVQKSVEAVSQRVGDEGFAFANVNPMPDVDEEARTVDLDFRVSPGRRVSVNEVNIEGNDRTQDRVIRREFRQMESARYQTSKIQRSKERVNRLGYFDSVNLETPSVPGRNDAVDLDLSVEERPTGQFSVGVGYSDVEGVLFTSSIKQNNLFGRGQRLSLQADIGGVNQSLNLSVTEPYFTVDGVSLGGDVYYTKRDTDRLTLFRYSQDRAGLAGRLGFPLSEYWRDSLRLAFEQTDTESGTLELGAEEEEFLGTQDHLLLRNTLTYDSRDSTIFPRKGWKNELITEASLPGGDTRYLRGNVKSQVYFPLLSASTVSLGVEAGRLEGYNGESVPFYEHFYLGGARSVRGFDTYSLGPEDPDGNPIGGVTKLQANSEFIFPIPGAEDTQGIRGAVFADAGWVYGPGQEIDPSELRASVGIGFRWFSPMGPLRFDYAVPVQYEPEDDLQRFQFTIGTNM